MATFVYPTNSTLDEIAQIKTPVLTMDDPLFGIMPITEHDTDLVQWEQRDDFIGLIGLNIQTRTGDRNLPTEALLIFID